MNKQQKHYLQAYATSKDFSIFHAYQKPSYNKQRIEQAIFNDMDKNNGYDYRILSHNCNFFTCAYMLNEDTLKVFTPYKTFTIKGAL